MERAAGDFFELQRFFFQNLACTLFSSLSSFDVADRAIALGTDRGSENVRVFTRGGFRGLRSYYSELPSHSHFSFSANSQVSGKCFSENGSRTLEPTEDFTTPFPIVGMTITGETEIRDSTRRRFGRWGPGSGSFFNEREEGRWLCLCTLPIGWCTVGYNNRHFPGTLERG